MRIIHISAITCIALMVIMPVKAKLKKVQKPNILLIMLLF